MPFAYGNPGYKRLDLLGFGFSPPDLWYGGFVRTKAADGHVEVGLSTALVRNQRPECCASYFFIAVLFAKLCLGTE